MEQLHRAMSVDGVAMCTVQAAHRRDHQHDADTCHPHTVEVVRLGDRAVMVCHDCGTDTGFVTRRDADELAAQHRRGTQPAPTDSPVDTEHAA